MQKLALLSVSDKTGLVDFARALVDDHGYQLLSTGGTAQALEKAGLPVTEVSEHTGFPEIMDGRVKTLHPKIHGGLLCRRDRPEQLAQARDNAIQMIDLVVVNLYPFEKTVANRDASYEDGIENIDIGGPSMLRSAAKNHASVTVVCDPADYAAVLQAMATGDGELGQLRTTLALKVFQRTAAYDAAISAWLEQKTDPGAMLGLPGQLHLVYPRAQTLRYGENPHQKAALYGGFNDCFEQIQGKALSYNNILDITAAAFLIGEFQKCTLAILKHTNPCGVASAATVHEAWKLAFATDTQAPFGGIIIMNRTLDDELAGELSNIFCEVIIAPDFSPGAIDQLGKKKNLRLMKVRDFMGIDSLREVRSVPGGLLLQDRDAKREQPAEFKVVSKRQPTEREWADMRFGWGVVKHVKSNAIVYAGEERTLGIGAGQMSRVDSSRIAVWKAGEAGLSLENSVIASDAFFPFADGLIAAAEAGASAAIQPGGSVRDDEVIAAADARNMAMVFTGTRHFKH